MAAVVGTELAAGWCPMLGWSRRRRSRVLGLTGAGPTQGWVSAGLTRLGSSASGSGQLAGTADGGGSAVGSSGSDETKF
jgi:hypothetical protein